MPIRIKRAYVRPANTNGHRILVDRFWSSGLTKADLKLDMWMRDVCQSKELCKWFGYDPGRWAEFQKRYFQGTAGASRPTQRTWRDGAQRYAYLDLRRPG